MAETTTRKHRSRWWALAALSLSLLAVGLDTYILSTALPTLSAALGASTSQLQWITDAYTLAMAAVLLPAGQLGDRLGHRTMLLAGLALFGVASVITSQVHTVAELIAMRAVMGAGAAVILPLSISILPGLFPGDHERRRAVAATAICTMIGMPAGPLLAGWMLTHFAWGSVFLINGPLAALSLAGVALLVPRSPAESGRAESGRAESGRAVPGREALGSPRLDWAGALLSAAGLTAVVYGIIEQPDHGWDLAVLASLASGALLLAGFAARQFRAASPLVDLRLFASRGFTWGTVAFAVVSFAMTGVLFVLTPYLQLVQGADAQVTGLRLIPMIGAMLASAAVIEKSSARLGTRLVIAAGMLVSAGGLALLSRAPAGGGYGLPALALAVFGIGLGLSLPLSADAVLATLPAGAAGAGNALNRAVQRIAVCLAPAVAGSALNAAYRAQLAGTPVAGLSRAERTAATSSIAAAHVVAGRLPASVGRTLAAAADHAYRTGMVRAAVISAVVLAAGALLVLLFLPGRRPARQSAHQSAQQPGGDSGGPGLRLDDQVDRPADHGLHIGHAEAGAVEPDGGPEPGGAVVSPGLGDPDLGGRRGPVRRD
jgi:MFS transporter, DHA2 family, multidrug resistance protein